MDDKRRITLISRNPSLPSRDWDATTDSSTRIIFVKSISVLEYALRNAVAELSRDVERVIVDRAGNAADYLELLARLPHAYQGDVLMIRLDGNGYLSAIGRGDGRLLYQLSATDVEFYLATHGLLLAMPHLLTA